MKTSGRNSRILTTVRRGFSSTRVGLAAKRAGSCGMPVKLSSGCAGIDARFTACIWPRLRVGKGAVGETGRCRLARVPIAGSIRNWTGFDLDRFVRERLSASAEIAARHTAGDTLLNTQLFQDEQPLRTQEARFFSSRGQPCAQASQAWGG